MRRIISLILSLFGASVDGDRRLDRLSVGLVRGLALASGILGLILAPLPIIGLVLPVVAITLGSIAMAIAGNQPRRIAAIGLILGLVGALVNLAVLIRLFG